MATNLSSILPHSQLFYSMGLGLCVAAVLLAACGKPGGELGSESPGEGIEQSTTVAHKEYLQPILSAGNGIPAGVEGYGVSLSRLPAEGGSAPLKAVFSKDTYEPRLDLAPESGWDWSNAGDSIGLSLSVANPGDHSAQLFVSVYDDKTFGTRSFNVPAGGAGTYYFDLNGPALALDTGMRDAPALYDNAATAMTWMWGSKSLDLSSIRHVELNMKSILSDRTLVLEDIALATNGEFQPQNLHGIFDQYGQYASQDYPEKIHSDDALRASAQREAEQFSAQPTFADRSRFGGWAKGPQYEATGYFRTQKIDGQWALIDPEGYLFFATGVDNMRMDNTVTMTGVDFAEPDARKGPVVASELRKNLFQWLPEEQGALSSHYVYRPVVHTGPVEKGEGFSFYRANLERKYGPDYLQRWREVTIDRQLDWGFTTLGNWADPSLYDNGKVAYVANGWIRGDHKRVSSGDDYWGPLHDPFDPEFVRSVKRTVAQVAAEVQSDPWCMGVYIENELSWGNTKSDAGHFGLIIHTLTRDAAESPAKAAFVELLRARYTSVENLSRAWSLPLTSRDASTGTSAVTSWEAFADGFALPASANGKPLIDGALREDFSLLLESLSAQFFSVVQRELAAVMPNHLFLGARFADWGMTPEVVRGAAAHVDVVSYNLYTEGLAAGNWDFLAEIDKPSIIGEFHMGATDSGSFHAGLVSAESQQERGEMFRDYMHTIIDNPWFVGAQWFQYIDSPASGRAWDGENYNVGFVTVADEPYGPMVAAAQALNRELYPRRYGQKND
ncbi:agarase [uncultured Microbulbifer sp.]|uniref:agarase n=1 Tax=uncultured Microbulbifer sp. TaxID=348147 RepID=UPI002626C39A|nr:agarase [uncultured Microbulbifer sp.]